MSGALSQDNVKMSGRMSDALSQGNACILYRVYRTAAPPRARALGTLQVVTAR